MKTLFSLICCLSFIEINAQALSGTWYTSQDWISGTNIYCNRISNSAGINKIVFYPDSSFTFSSTKRIITGKRIFYYDGNYPSFLNIKTNDSIYFCTYLFSKDLMVITGLYSGVEKPKTEENERKIFNYVIQLCEYPGGYKWMANKLQTYVDENESLKKIFKNDSLIEFDLLIDHEGRIDSIIYYEPLIEKRKRQLEKMFVDFPRCSPARLNGHTCIGRFHISLLLRWHYGRERYFIQVTCSG